MQRHVVEAFHRKIKCPWHLPGRSLDATEWRAENSGHAITISRGSTAIECELRQMGSYALGSNGLRIAVSEGLTFLCDPTGQSICVDADAGISENFISQHLVANGVPAALWMQGERLLHAGAFCLSGPSAAVLVAGDSGSGKSTILAELVASGACLIAEDACTLHVSGGSVEVAGFSALINLREGEGRQDRMMRPVPVAQQMPAAKAAALVVIDTALASEHAGPTLVHGIQKLGLLLRHRYRAAIPMLLRHDAHHFRAWADSAASLSVYSWNPWLSKRQQWLPILAGLSLAGRAGGFS